MDELAKRFADLATQYGPPVGDAAMGAARVEAYSSLMAAGEGLLAAAGIAWIGRLLLRKAALMDDEDDDRLFPMIFGYVCFALAGFVGIVWLWTFLDPWTWTQINHPELWLAKRAFKI